MCGLWFVCLECACVIICSISGLDELIENVYVIQNSIMCVVCGLVFVSVRE